MADRSEITNEIFAWLNQVKADPSLLASDFKTAFQLTQKTHTETFVKTAVLVTWQSRSLIATEIQMGERTVHDAIKRLAAGEHLTIDIGHGPGRSNRYSLINKGRQTAAYNGQQSAAYKRQDTTGKEAKCDSNSGSLSPPNSSSNNSDNSSRARGPSSPDGLGPLGAIVSSRIGADVYKSWLSDASVVDDTDTTITIALPSSYLADTVRQRFDDVLLQSAQAIDPKKVRIDIISQGARP